MAAQRRGSRRVSARSRRETSWSVGPGASTAQSITSAQSLILGASLVPSEEGLTVIRTRGLLELNLNAVSAVGAGFHGASGLCIVSADAVAAGAASIPSPVGDAGWDGWFWHSFFDVHTITATIADGVNATAVHKQFMVDSKAMRKFRTNEAMVWMLETAAEVGTATMFAHADSRLLHKLS